MNVLQRLMNDGINNDNLKEEAFLAKEITFYRLDNNGNKFQVSGTDGSEFEGFLVFAWRSRFFFIATRHKPNFVPVIRMVEMSQVNTV